LLGHLNDILDFFVFIDDFRESVSQGIDLLPHAGFLFLGDLHLSVFFCAKFGLLDGVDSFIYNINGVCGHLKDLLEIAAIQTINMGVNVGDVRRVVLLELDSLLVFNLLNLIVRHEISSLDAFKRIKLGLLLDHEFVDRMDKNQTIIAC